MVVKHHFPYLPSSLLINIEFIFSGGAIESAMSLRSIAINFARFPKWQVAVREKLQGKKRHPLIIQIHKPYT